MKYGTLILLAALSVSTIATSKPQYPATLFTFCLAERTDQKDPCNFRQDVSPDLADVEVRYVPREASTPEALGKFFCSELASRHDDFLLIHVAGHGSIRPEGYTIDWVDSDGLPRSLGMLTPDAIQRQLAACVPNGVADIAMLFDSSLARGSAPRNEDWPGSTLVSDKVHSFGFVDGAERRALDFKITFEMNAEKKAAKVADLKTDPWNKDIDDMPYLPLAAAAPAACRAVWKPLIEMDAALLARGELIDLHDDPSCKPPMRSLSETHDYYVRDCKPFFTATETAPTEDQKESCLRRVIPYRAALRHWQTRNQDPATISDVTLLADKAVYASTGGMPLSKYPQASRLQLAVGDRLTKLCPQSAYAWRVAMAGAESLAGYARDEHQPLDQQLQFLKTAETYADHLLKVPNLASQHWREDVWYSKTWAMEPERMRKLLPEIRRTANDPDLADYYLAFVAHEEGKAEEATRLLQGILKRTPDDERAREALQKGRWTGFAISGAYPSPDDWRELLR